MKWKNITVTARNGAIIYEGPLNELPVKEEYIIEKSRELYNEEEPCIIYRTHITKKLYLDIWDQLKSFNDDATISKAMGFTFNAEPVKTEYAACTAVLEQYRCSLESGAMEPEATLKQFNDALYSAGLQTVIDEKQKQLNEWANK